MTIVTNQQLFQVVHRMEEKSNGSTYSSETSLQDKTERKGCWARYFPYGFWAEWRRLAILAVPIVVETIKDTKQVLITGKPLNKGNKKRVPRERKSRRSLLNQGAAVTTKDILNCTVH
ncbi:hypothetical protein ACTXT7_000138 [Hymenolepis weldensis]